MSSTLRQSSSEHSQAQLFAGLERLAADPELLGDQP